jgi:hypothetical protein
VLIFNIESLLRTTNYLQFGRLLDTGSSAQLTNNGFQIGKNGDRKVYKHALILFYYLKIELSFIIAFKWGKKVKNMLLVQESGKVEKKLKGKLKKKKRF